MADKTDKPEKAAKADKADKADKAAAKADKAAAPKADKAAKQDKKGKEKKPEVDANFNFIVRIADSDIDGQKRTVIGIQQIKGVGKRVAQIVVKKANVDPKIKIGSLPDEKTKELESLIKTYVEYAPEWAINRPMDYESGADMHLIGNDLEITQKDDINRMKMIRCYRGVRHDTHHKVRGQRTRSNGRHGLTMGVSKKKEEQKGAAKAPAKSGKA